MLFTDHFHNFGADNFLQEQAGGNVIVVQMIVFLTLKYLSWYMCKHKYYLMMPYLYHDSFLTVMKRTWAKY